MKADDLKIDLKFKDIKHFTPDEFDRPDMLDCDALRLLDKMRHEEGKRWPIIITINGDFAITGHSPDSRHKFGDAFDLVIRHRETRKPLPILAQYAMASRYMWGGIGIYPFWDDPGLHTDRRPWAVFGRRALWYRDKVGEYQSILKYLS